MRPQIKELIDIAERENWQYEDFDGNGKFLYRISGIEYPAIGILHVLVNKNIAISFATDEYDYFEQMLNRRRVKERTERDVDKLPLLEVFLATRRP